MTDESDKPKETYEIGYGKPPQRTQFQKGHSGNARGRPKGSLNVTTILEEVLLERVPVKENGRQRSLTKLETTIKRMVHDAIAGNARARQQVIDLLQNVGLVVKDGIPLAPPTIHVHFREPEVTNGVPEPSLIVREKNPDADE